MGFRKSRRSPREALQALDTLMDLRDDPRYAEGEVVSEAASAAFEAEVALNALAGKGSLPRRVRAELHQMTEARRNQAAEQLSAMVTAQVAEAL